MNTSPPTPPGPDLLADPLFIVAPDGPAAPLTLPDLLARLLVGPEVDGFPDLAAEQRGYWWRFLVRCAAKVLHERKLTVDAAAALPAEELATQLRETLTALVPPGGWALYQPDPTRPGFLQAPTPDGVLLKGKYSANTMSLLTGTLGTKNHERKYDTGRILPAESAVYALIEYQMGVVYGGRGNYGAQLMGSVSGAGSGTPFVGARIDGSRLETFRHDVAVLLASRPSMVEQNGLRGNIWALWAEPWDGVSSLNSAALDPTFIPLARLVRLAAPDAHARFDAVWFRPTEVARVRDHTDGGDLGDPFLPLVPNPKTGAWKVRGTLDKGYDCAEVTRMLFNADSERPYRPSPSVAALMKHKRSEARRLEVVFEGTAYEQGKTGGFHRRVVMLRPGAMDLLGDPKLAQALHKLLFTAVGSAKLALRGAASILLTGALPKKNAAEGKIGLLGRRLEAEVDAIYLDRLFEAAERVQNGEDKEEILTEWASVLNELARRIFREGTGALPVPVARRLERETAAESFLASQLWKLYPEGRQPARAPLPIEQETPA